MNTMHDLEGEFARLASNAPEYDAVRRAVADRMSKRDKRRRTASLVAVAAAVVLVAGGIGVTRALVSGGPDPARPAAPNAVVPVPDVPLPADTQLVRHQLQPVTSPVTATPPEGLTGMAWMQSPGRLAVSWSDPTAAAGAAVGWTSYAPLADPAEVKTAGYAITDSEDDPLQTIGKNGLAPAEVVRTDISVGGHQAVLTTAPPNTSDVSGFPATERLSWQLADGRFIHVWAAGSATRDSSPSTALTTFAESITEKPQTLVRTVGLGLTLPGLTVDSSLNMSPVTSYIGGSVIMCAPGVDPLAPTYSSVGSGSWSGAGSTGPGSGAPESPSIAPGSGVGAVTSSGDPAAPCLSASVASATVIAAPKSGSDGATSVGDVAVHVEAEYNQATADLGNGLVAVVRAPDTVKLAAADLAALAASVRFSPDVEVIPFTVPGGQGSGESASAWGSSSSAASSSAASVPGAAGSRPIEVDAAVPVTAAADTATKTVAVEFTVRNATDSSPRLTVLDLTMPGMAQQSVKMRLGNVAADAQSPFQDAVLPALLAPHTRVRVQVTFRVDQCSAVTGTSPQLKMEWEVGDSNGGGSEQDLPIASVQDLELSGPASGLVGLLKSLCD